MMHFTVVIVLHYYLHFVGLLCVKLPWFDSRNLLVSVTDKLTTKATHRERTGLHWLSVGTGLNRARFCGGSAESTRELETSHHDQCFSKKS